MSRYLRVGKESGIESSSRCREEISERQLTEAELKVQRSLQKLSIPDWYLNKRSDPPKILSNVTPIESRPSSWKNTVRKKPALNDTVLYPECSSGIYTTPRRAEPKISGVNGNTDTYKITRPPRTPSSSPRKSPSKSQPTKKEIFDMTIPKLKISRNISKTFPKVSPSRKIRNINIVFPPALQADVAPLEDDAILGGSKYSTFVLKKKPGNTEAKVDAVNEVNKVNEVNEVDEVDKWKTPTKGRIDFTVDALVESFETPNGKLPFKVRAASTPKCAQSGGNLYSPTSTETTSSPVSSSTVVGETNNCAFMEGNIFSSTVIEGTPKMGKLPCRMFAERSVIEASPKKASCSFEDGSLRESTWLGKKALSRSFIETAVIDETPKKNSGRKPKPNLFLESRIRSIEPIIFEMEDNGTQQSPAASCVREIINKIDSKSQPRDIPPRKALHHPSSEQNQPSPCTRFFYSKKKSTELENIVKRTTQPTRGKGLVKGIIEELNEKVKTSSLKHNRATPTGQNFVKNLVNALEKGDTSELEEVLVGRRKSSEEEDLGSCSESDLKSAASSTTVSVKDTDSSSDFDPRSPSLRSDEDNRFDYGVLATANLLDATVIHGEEEEEEEEDEEEEDDSVYWIPVSRCKLPRTSSLLSMMSRLSVNSRQSPCISPIRSDNGSRDCCQHGAWGVTFKKTLSKRLFRIDETAITDSGYSDKSDRSAGSYLTDGTLSEDTQNDSGSEGRLQRVKRTTTSSRRKTIANLAHPPRTFAV